MVAFLQFYAFIFACCFAWQVGRPSSWSQKVTRAFLISINSLFIFFRASVSIFLLIGPLLLVSYVLFPNLLYFAGPLSIIIENVTANVEETEIDEVKVGQTVDVYVDSYPDTTLSGEVEQIGMTTAGTFSMMPSSNGTANYTKVAQVIPVKVSLSQEKSLDIRPGMNVTVRIHKD